MGLDIFLKSDLIRNSVARSSVTTPTPSVKTTDKSKGETRRQPTRKRSSKRSSILTGPRGLIEEAETANKTLLGN